MIMRENNGTSNVWVGSPEIDLRACAGHKDQRHVTRDRCDGRHQNRPQPHPRCFRDGGDFGEPGLLQFIREFDNEDAVLGNQADQRDQADL